MLVAEGVVAALLAAVSVYLIKAGLREWRGIGTPLSQRSATLLMDAQTRAGMDRGGLVFGFGFAFMALMLACVATALHFPHPGHGTRLVVGVACATLAVAMIVCIAMGWSIVNFNWPKVLVPPQHRGEPGPSRPDVGNAAAKEKGRLGRVTDNPARSISLLPGEQACARIVANHIQGGRAFEGHLHVTSQRLVFVPWPASVVRGGTSSVVQLADVSQVDVAPRGSNYRDGSWRRRLRVRTLSGETELFVVWNPKKAADLIERCRQPT